MDAADERQDGRVDGGSGTMTLAGSIAHGRREHFHHEALFYTGERGFLAGALPFISGALEADEPMLVAVGQAKIDLLTEALGDDARRVRFADMRLLGDNPARIIPAWQDFLGENPAHRHAVRGIGEPIWPGRTPAEVTECQRHESLLNVAFDGGRPWRLLCPYDMDGLDDAVIEAAQRSHPFLADGDGSRTSEVYAPAPNAPGPFHGELAPPPAYAHELSFSDTDLEAVRRLVSGWAAEQELAAERTEHLVLAVSELASNSLRHGGGVGTVRMWSERETLFVDVHDKGQIEAPLVGRTRPDAHGATGRGLWLVNHLCDLVQIRSGPSGTVVRVHMRLS